jgi:hypothetical protein
MYLFLFLISSRRHVWGRGLDHLFHPPPPSIVFWYKQYL